MISPPSDSALGHNFFGFRISSHCGFRSEFRLMSGGMDPGGKVVLPPDRGAGEVFVRPVMSWPTDEDERLARYVNRSDRRQHIDVRRC